VVTVDPELVVIGGSLSRAGEFVADPIRKHLEKNCVFEPRVVVSPLGDEAVALGAVRVALDDVDGRLFTESGISDVAPHQRVVVADAPARAVRFAGRRAEIATP
jgi:predicted NBD/HSP70 family sugar kinase